MVSFVKTALTPLCSNIERNRHLLFATRYARRGGFTQIFGIMPEYSTHIAEANAQSARRKIDALRDVPAQFSYGEIRIRHLHQSIFFRLG